MPLSINENAGEIKRILEWYADIGVDEIVGLSPRNRYEEEEDDYRLTVERQEQSGAEIGRNETSRQHVSQGRMSSSVSPYPHAQPAKPRPQVQAAKFVDTRALAAQCKTLEELHQAIISYQGLAITKTSTHTVFADGNPQADVMFIGEAPGNEEDRQGLPFVGPAGQLLDRMLAAIGRDRSSVYISNILNWRPPGNRTPTPEEAHACLPFIRRHIQLVEPKIIVLLGGTSAKHLLGTTQGIMRLRGKWASVMLDEDGDSQIKALPTLHPAYLLRTPSAKKMAWADFLKLDEWLSSQS